jgi:membrane-associated phospholipid phosphatase
MKIDSLKDILDIIGIFGPLITTGITGVSLLENPTYLLTFILGSLLNNYLNEYLKLQIKQPRPTNQVHYLDDKNILKGPHVYGMPSGHAQITSFAVATLYLTKGPTTWILGSLFIFGLTVFQRWSFRRHTIEQLIVGTIIGTSFAFIIFWTTKKYLERVI